MNTLPSRGSKEGAPTAPTAAPSIFAIKPANAWLQEAASRPLPRDLWKNRGIIYTGMVTCIFGQPGAGKTILATQIAADIARAGTPVLYLDCGQPSRAFTSRYRTAQKQAAFPDSLLRAHLDLCPENKKLKLEDLLDALTEAIKQSGASVIFIDDITTIIASVTRCNPINLMAALNRLANENDLTLILVAQTPRRAQHRAVTETTMGRLKSIWAYVDSLIAITQLDETVHYIKQLKRSYGGPIRFGAEGIIACQLNCDTANLHFEEVDQLPESALLSEPKTDDQQQTVALVQEMHNMGSTVREIAQELNLSPATISRYLHIHNPKINEFAETLKQEIA